MNATLSQVNLRKSFSYSKFFQKCKLLHFKLGEDFMIQKAGVGNLPPLEGSCPQDLGNTRE
jgi:hypothetical protein